MPRKLVLLAAAACMLGLIGPVFSNGKADHESSIVVSPQTLVLSMDQGGAVTVHTNIPFASVDESSLTLNDVPAEAAWPDNRGHLVARFDEQAIEDLVEPPSATLVLEGVYQSGGPFDGSDEVRVIE